MRRTQLTPWLETLCAACLGALICLGLVGCIMTAYELPGDWLNAWKFCAISALLTALCCHWRHSPWLLIPLGLGLAWYLRGRTGWMIQLESLLNAISRRVDTAYGWGAISWSGRTLSGRPVIEAMKLLSLLPCVTIVWPVRRHGRIWLGMLVSVLALGSCMIVTDTVPDPLPLTMVLLGLGLLVLTQGVRRQNGWEGCKLTALLLIPVLLVVMLVAAAVPRKGFARSDLALRTQNGIVRLLSRLPFVIETEDDNLALDFGGGMVEDKLSLANVGPRRELRYRVMTVTAENGGFLYLRGQTLGTYTGTDWEKLDTDFTSRFPSFTRRVAYSLPDELGKDGGLVTISTPQPQELLFTPYYPVSSGLADYLEGDAYVRNDMGLSEYTYDTLHWPSGAAYVESALLSDYFDFALDNYLQLPEETETWAKEYLLREVFDGKDAQARDYLERQWMQLELGLRFYDTSEMVRLASGIRNFVERSASYDLNTPRMPEDETDFARWFLEDSETGYCTHFASAAVVLLRAAGIPARYASGYYMTNLPAGAPTGVTTDRAHAWAEYFLYGVGWVVLDPTPSRENQNRQETTRPTKPTEPTESREPRPTTEPTKPTEPKEPAKQESAAWKTIRKVLLTLAKLAAIVAAIWLQSRARLRLRERWLSGGTVKQQILRRWRFARYLARLRKQKPPEELHELALEAKFSNHTMEQPQVRPLADYAGSVVAELRQSSILIRLCCRVVLALW